MSSHSIEVIHDTPMITGESPVWHAEEAALYWIDIPGKAVHRLQPESGAHRLFPMPAEPGCIVRSSGGGLIVALRTGIAHLDTHTGALSLRIPAPYDPAVIRFNDGRCDPSGRLWVGTLYDPRDRPGATLYCLDRGSLRDVDKPVTVSNGVAFSLDGRTLFHADTSAHIIRTYDVDPASGMLSGERVLRRFSDDKAAPDYIGRPDGAAVDAEGAYWCAMYEGGRLLRLSSSGETLDEILLPVRCPTMMAFGGPDLKTLYVTCASKERPQEELTRYPLTGKVLALRVTVPGVPEPLYAE